jgi:hypothetical protein
MAFDITVPSPLCPSNAAATAADHVAWLESVASLRRRKYSEAKGVAFRPLWWMSSALLITIHHIARLLQRRNYFRPWLLNCSKELASLFTGRSVLASSPGVISLLSNRCFFVNQISFCTP